MKTCIAVVVLAVIWLQTSSAEYRYGRYKMPLPPRPPQQPHYAKKWTMAPPPRYHHQQQLQMRQHLVHKPMRPPVIPVHMPTTLKMPYSHYIKQQQPQAQALPSMPKPVIGIPTGPVVHQQRPYWAYKAQPQLKKHLPFQSSQQITTEYDYHIQNNLIPTHSNLIKQVDDKGPIHTIPAPNLSLADKPIVVEEVKPESTRKPQYQVVESGQDYATKLKTTQVYHPVTVQSVPTQNTELQFTQQELFQFLNTYPQQQLETYAIPVIQQTPVVTQLFQPEPAYIPQVSQKVKDEFKPEFHTFNYEEQAPKVPNFSNRGFEPEPSETIETSKVVVSPSSSFNTVQVNSEKKESEGILSPVFYTSLPSKEAADSFAALYSAGQAANAEKDNQQQHQHQQHQQQQLQQQQHQQQQHQQQQQQHQHQQQQHQQQQHQQHQQSVKIFVEEDDQAQKDQINNKEYDDNIDDDTKLSDDDFVESEQTSIAESQMSYGNRIKPKSKV